jgi:2-phosphoglycolate phosphatase
MTTFSLDAVLFDLDGTLADTAPDLLRALNVIRIERGHAPITLEALRPWVSKGARAMLLNGFPENPDAADTLVPRFLEIYEADVSAHTRLFDGVYELLDALDERGLPWGIVTNKPGFLTTPVLEALRLDGRAQVVVSGDTLAVKKPDPAPVRHACEILDVRTDRVALVGDDRRDIDAALGADAIGIVADWGYIGADENPAEWGAQARIARPLDLLKLIATH